MTLKTNKYMVIFCGNTLLATIKGLKFIFSSFFNDAYSITNFTHVKCMRFSRTTLLPVTLQNCFATVEGASRTMNGKEIRSRFARGKYVGNVENRERIRTSSSRNQERRHALLLPHSRSQEQKCVAPKKASWQLDDNIKWLGDLNASIPRIEERGKQTLKYSCPISSRTTYKGRCRVAIRARKFFMGQHLPTLGTLRPGPSPSTNLRRMKEGERSTLSLHFRSF